MLVLPLHSGKPITCIMLYIYTHAMYLSRFSHACRPQRKQDCKHLATIEAIYYFFREMSELVEGHTYNGLYDNLLFFYAYQYGIIQQAQQERT